jgi:hypothetical protein
VIYKKDKQAKTGNKYVSEILFPAVFAITPGAGSRANFNCITSRRSTWTPARRAAANHWFAGWEMRRRTP